MVYKSLNGLAPDYMHSMFTDRESVTSVQLRDTENKLAVPMPRTNYLKNSFSYSTWCCAVEQSSNRVIRQAQSLFNGYF